ncbi:MAG TPA: hypothetical protein VGD00_06770, partial [Solirubrobacteraceae bacterium]
GIAAGTAQADVGQKIILRCTHHESLAGFSQADYRRALKEMSATTEEYSPCGEEIRKAQEAAAAGRGGGAGAAGLATPIPSTPAERSALARAAAKGGAPVRLGGQVVHPGVVHANVASAFSTLPGSLLAVLGFLLASLLVAGGMFAHRRYGLDGASLRRRFGGRRGD